MPEENQTTENRTGKCPVAIREGKWVTDDGLSFNTATKAWTHAGLIPKAVADIIEEHNQDVSVVDPEVTDGIL